MVARLATECRINPCGAELFGMAHALRAELFEEFWAKFSLFD